MLYMVISTHGPETCAAANESAKQMALAMAPKMDKAAKSHGCAIQGSWIHPSNHTSWVIMDAPHAHAVEQLCGSWISPSGTPSTSTPS